MGAWVEFPSAFAAYRKAFELRRHLQEGPRFDRVDDIVEQRFWTMARAPVASLGQAIVKGEAMLDEYGGAGELRTDLVRMLIVDLRALDSWAERYGLPM